jgi:hypothetical protein
MFGSRRVGVFPCAMSSCSRLRLDVRDATGVWSDANEMDLRRRGYTQCAALARLSSLTPRRDPAYGRPSTGTLCEPLQPLAVLSHQHEQLGAR